MYSSRIEYSDVWLINVFNMSSGVIMIIVQRYRILDMETKIFVNIESLCFPYVCVGRTRAD